MKEKNDKTFRLDEFTKQAEKERKKLIYHTKRLAEMLRYEYKHKKCSALLVQEIRKGKTYSYDMVELLKLAIKNLRG